MPIFNEFQAGNLMDEWKMDRTAGTASRPEDNVDIPWNVIWELDRIDRKDPGGLKTAL